VSDDSRTALERNGGLVGIVGICIFIASKALKLGNPGSAYMTLAGLSILVVGCLLLGVAYLRKKETKNKIIGAAIFLVIIYNLVVVYRAVFVMGTLDVF